MDLHLHIFVKSLKPDRKCTTATLYKLRLIPKWEMWQETYKDDGKVKLHNTDTEGAIESVHINGVSVLSGLNLEKM